MKKLFNSIYLAAIVLAVNFAAAPTALAFCISNQSLSDRPVEVVQLSEEDISLLGVKARQAISSCDAFSGELKRMCVQERAKFNIKAEMAAQDAKNFLTSLPLYGDEISEAGQFVRKKFYEGLWAVSDGFFAAMDFTSTRFKKTIKPNETQCCNWQDKGCNPNGRKDSIVGFRIKSPWPKDFRPSYKAPPYHTRVILARATDHIECQTDTTSSKRYGCLGYRFPDSPFRGHKTTLRNVMLKSAHSGKCLDIAGANRKPGAKVIMWDCHGRKNQRWTIHKEGVIRSELNGLCLHVAGVSRTTPGKNGLNVHMWECNNLVSQRWQYNPAFGVLINKAPGKRNWCLDVAGWNKKNGAKVHIWQCGKNQANQTWKAAAK